MCNTLLYFVVALILGTHRFRKSYVLEKVFMLVYGINRLVQNVLGRLSYNKDLLVQ